MLWPRGCCCGGTGGDHRRELVWRRGSQWCVTVAGFSDLANSDLAKMKDWGSDMRAVFDDSAIFAGGGKELML